MSGTVIEVALYARVSSDKQSQDGTMASQVAALKDRIVREGLTVRADRCFVDEGYTGATMVRPGLERLRDLAALGVLDRLYVYGPDRLARSYAYQVLLLEEFRRDGLEVVFLTNPPGQTSAEQLLVQVQGMVAEYERALILERTRRGRWYAARQGRVSVLSSAPYGYRYVKSDLAGGSARYEVFLEEARVVRQIFEWVGREHLSLGQVSRRLLEAGIGTPRGRGVWSRSGLRRILRNPAYRGLAAFGKTRQEDVIRPPLRPLRGHSGSPRYPYPRRSVPPDQWVGIPVPALVAPALFEAVGEQLEDNQARSRLSGRGARYLLQGIVVCGQCGYAYVGGYHRREDGRPVGRYYRCAGRSAGPPKSVLRCDNRRVAMDRLDDQVWQDVCGLLAEPSQVQEEFDRRVTDEKGEAGGDRLHTTQALIRKIERGMNRLVDAYQNEWLEPEEFQTRMAAARDRRDTLQREVRVLLEDPARDRDLRLAIGHLEEFADRLQEGLRQADFATRRAIIRTLVRKVEIGAENIRIVYRIGPPRTEPGETIQGKDCNYRASGSHVFSGL